MKNQLKFTILFLIINFGGLAIGNWFMNNGPISEWYLNLNKAPWTPPGWVFGVAWTINTQPGGIWCSLDNYNDLFFSVFR